MKIHRTEANNEQMENNSAISSEEKENTLNETPPQNAIEKQKNLFAIWTIVLSMYVVLLIIVGYLTFVDQDFNKPQSFIGAYVDQVYRRDFLYTKLTIDKTEQPNSDFEQIDDESFRNLVYELMESAANTAGDQQELASQSFNIVLGALLAFLSASATIIFQMWKRDK